MPTLAATCWYVRVASPFSSKASLDLETHAWTAFFITLLVLQFVRVFFGGGGGGCFDYFFSTIYCWLRGRHCQIRPWSPTWPYLFLGPTQLLLRLEILPQSFPATVLVSICFVKYFPRWRHAFLYSCLWIYLRISNEWEWRLCFCVHWLLFLKKEPRTSDSDEFVYHSVQVVYR